MARKASGCACAAHALLQNGYHQENFATRHQHKKLLAHLHWSLSGHGFTASCKLQYKKYGKACNQNQTMANRPCDASKLWQPYEVEPEPLTCSNNKFKTKSQHSQLPARGIGTAGMRESIPCGRCKKSQTSMESNILQGAG